MTKIVLGVYLAKLNRKIFIRMLHRFFMKFEYSLHWKRKREIRKEITDDLIEYAIQHSNVLRDKNWPDTLNAICRVPPMGRILKVVYKRVGKGTIKIITAFWLD